MSGTRVDVRLEAAVLVPGPASVSDTWPPWVEVIIDLHCRSWYEMLRARSCPESCTGSLAGGVGQLIHQGSTAGGTCGLTCGISCRPGSNRETMFDLYGDVSIQVENVWQGVVDDFGLTSGSGGTL